MSTKPQWHKPSWSTKQQARLRALLARQAKNPDKVLISYCCTDQWGGPANGGVGKLRARTGAVQRLTKGNLSICSYGFHATKEPHRWAGKRVWIVALLGERQEQGDKAAALKREIVGEILPEDCMDQSVAARMNLARAYLAGANLAGANLAGANLAGANLEGANLEGANLEGANLAGAYLAGANLVGAYLAGANLAGANLAGAYLVGAYLVGNARPIWLPDLYEVRDGHICRKESW